MLKNSQSRYGMVSIIVHWLVAVTVFGLFAVGFWMVDLSYYSSWYEDHLDSAVISIEDGGLPIYEDSQVIVDAEVGWTFASGLYVNVGAQNLFDETPDDNPWGASVAGAAYPVHSPYGFNGGFYYARVGWKF